MTSVSEKDEVQPGEQIEEKEPKTENSDEEEEEEEEKVHHSIQFAMDRFVIRKRKVLSDDEASSCTPATSRSINLNERSGGIPTTSSLTINLSKEEGHSLEKTAPYVMRKPGRQYQNTVQAGVNEHSEFSESQQKQMQDARKALLTILSSVRYLACQGIAIHGHNEEDANLKELLLLRVEDVPHLKSWLSCTNYEWISPTIVNEMLEIMCHNVLHELARKIKEAVYYSVIIDEAPDITTQEQVSFSFLIATEDLLVEEFFFGFYEIESATAKTLFSILKDILCRFDLSLDRCRGQCYDGALNVAGHLSGVQALVKAEEPRALYVHCFAHVVNLVVQDVSENVTMCRKFLSELSDMITFLKASPAWFKNFQQAENINPRQYCGTWWTVTAASLQSVASNYRELMQFFENLASEEIRDPWGKADGYANSLWRFDSYFMLQLLLLEFGHLDTLNTALQKSNLQFHQAELLLASAKESTKQLRKNFEQFWSKTVNTAKDLDLEAPAVPQYRKPAQHVDAGCDPYQFPSPKDFYRKIFFEIMDNIYSSLQNRFSSDVSQHMRKIEKFAIGEDDGTDILNFYKTDLDAVQLQLHRDMLLDIAKKQKVKLSALCDVIDLFSGEQGKCLRKLMPELAKLIRIGLTIPVSSCTSERSLSCLHRIKTFQWSSMTQENLNHMVLLYGHDRTSQEIDLNVIANEFIQRTSLRRNTFSVI